MISGIRQMVNEKLESEIRKIQECVLTKAKEVFTQMIATNSQIVDECTKALSDYEKIIDEMSQSIKSEDNGGMVCKKIQLKIQNCLANAIRYIRKFPGNSVKKDVAETLCQQVSVILNSQIN